MTKDTNYQALSAELATVLAKLQSAEVDVDEAVALYERGMAITGQLRDYLQSAENKVKKIKRKFND
jgi:exodeoxyribonuclease VII small subunit